MIFKKGDTIYVVGFSPPFDGGGVGGFDWTPDWKEAIDEFLSRVKEGIEDAIVVRPVHLPQDFGDRDEVTSWLDRDGLDLWNPPQIETVETVLYRVRDRLSVEVLVEAKNAEDALIKADEIPLDQWTIESPDGAVAEVQE